MAKQGSDPVDELLVMEAQDGDRRSMEELVRRWQRRLWTHAYQLTKDPEAAWDITQQTWLAVIRGLTKLHDPAKFKPWAYRIVTNKAVDYIKAKEPGRPLPDQPLEDTRAHDKSGSLLLELLDRLAPNKKAILVLYYLESLTIAEVSFVLGIPKGTVKSRLHKARNELKKLCQQGPEGGMR